jgi:glycosyltransferase involved in cell wall biosynthesis
MRILVCYPWLDLGGAPKTSITLAKGLKERGHEVYFFSKGGGMYEKLLDEAGIPLISAPHHRFLPLMFHLNGKAYRLFKNTLEDLSIDIVHVFHPNHYFLSLLIAPWKNIPVIFTAVWYQGTFNYPAYPGKVIFVAEEFLDHARPYIGKHASEMLIMPNRVDFDGFGRDIDFSRFAEKRGLPGHGTKIAFMSRLDITKEKSLYYAMDAAEALSDRGMETTLAVAGDGPLLIRLKEYASSLNNKHGREIIKFLGSIEEIPEFLSWSDVVLGVGRCAFEGMATGKPTCIVGENGLAGVVRDDTVRELQYYNFAGRNIGAPVPPSLLADAIEAIMKDRGDYERLADFSRKFVMENYGYRAGAERLERIYQEVLSEKPLNLYGKMKVTVSSFATGYCRSLYRTCKAKLKETLVSR